MKRGKHAKKPKLKKSIIVIPICLIAICILLNKTSPLISKEVQAIVENENIQDVDIEQTLSENDTLVEEVAVEEPIVEPSEDEEIKMLIQNTQAEHNLNENNFGFFYYNLDEKKYYFYNENHYFTAGSTVKVPIAMSYYDKINNGDLTSESKLIYHKDDYEEGSGATASVYSVGQAVPVNYLLKQSIINSDNTATNILISDEGYNEYRNIISKYSTHNLSTDFYTNNITCASYSYDVLNYLYEHKDSYSELIKNMEQSSMGLYLKKYISDYEVAHKYGSYEGNVHDYGIVFGKQTYLIGVFTKNVTNSDELIAKISLDVLNYTLQ